MPSCNATTLLAQAERYGGLSRRQLLEVETYLLCQLSSGLSANIIPPGSQYSGATPEFDIAILPNTTYTITWGSNEVSATICGTSFTSTGAGTQTNFFSATCTVLQLFGTFAGTTVTAVVKRSFKVSTPGGTVAADGTGNIIVTFTGWPSAGSTPTTYAEIWTAPDNVNFTLAATVTAPTLTGTVTAPATGSFKYVKWRGCASVGCGSFTSSVLCSGQVCDWVKRVVTNGGAVPSRQSQFAMATFDQTLVNNSLASSMLYALLYAPDSLTATLTPLYKTAGNSNDPASNHNFVAGDLNANGMLGAATKWLDSGWNDNGTLSSTPRGFTCVCVDTPQNINQGFMGESNQTGGAAFALISGPPLQAYMYDNTVGNGLLSVALPTIGCFLSVNRTSTTAAAMYAGDSTNGFRTLVSSGSTNTGSPNATTNAIQGLLFNGVFSGCAQRFSFAAIHSGFTSGQAQTLYNAVQTLRTAFGGGTV